MNKIFQVFDNYLKEIQHRYKDPHTSEYGYRTPFENFLQAIFTEVDVKEIEHDPKSRDRNKPDFVILKNNVPILYIETKDINASLDKVEQSEQMARYFGYKNLILTNYLEFRFFRDGKRYGEPISIGKIDPKTKKIIPLPQYYQLLYRRLLDFPFEQKEPIKSGLHLAKIMGGKARRIRDNVLDILKNGKSPAVKDLMAVFNVIKKTLLPDLTIEQFADMYAQTLVYGLFVARFYDDTPDDFSRREARDLIPPSNPFLRHFFDHIAGVNFPKRLEFIVDELCEVFTHADVEKLMDDYYKKDKQDQNKGPDPVVHFYEDFLKEYDPELRKQMGAYYTPEPVVQFIVKSVDEILKKDFKLTKGLADASKYENGVHKVQILDPATGTGTFISKTIGHIYQYFVKSKQTGRWPAYVHHDLLPRIHGFELMMAPYTIAHLKLSIALRKTGFKYFNRRLGIYLTNSLEFKEYDQKQNTLLPEFGLGGAITEESKQAEKIKKEMPIMVVIGNPPYSGESMNKGKWIMELMRDYKVEPGGKKKLKEKNPKWINDDYVKFIRLAQYFVEKNGIGLFAYITPHGFLDNPTFRGMRWKLQTVFDKIYILNLHGNVKKKETCPDGSKDENVFNIQQGVSINIFVKTTRDKDNKLAQVYYADLWGKRKDKFDFLNKHSVYQVNFKKIPVNKPMYFMVPKDFRLEKEYKQGFSLNELFPINSVGIVTANDKVLIAFTKDDLIKQIRAHYEIEPDEKYITKVSYRPFDVRYLYYDTNLVERTREKVMQHFLKGPNIGLTLCKQFKAGNNFQHVFVAKNIVESSYVSNKTSEITYVFPLYLYQNDIRIPNLNTEIMNRIKQLIGEFTPEELFDYIYAILHSPTYREKYKEFLKIEFPRIPYPKDRQSFKKLAKLGKQLRELHLMESEKLDKLITTYPVAGSDVVEKVEYKDGKVWINDEQYFGNVPELAWHFYIGGYQPARKWLKDRKGRTLTSDDIEHYQKIIKVLVETDKLMKRVDEVYIKI